LTLNGTIELGGASGTSNYAYLTFGSAGDNVAQTVSGAGTIQFGQNSTADYLYNQSNETLTFGPSITIQGGLNSQIDANSAGITNQGTLAESTSGGLFNIICSGVFLNSGLVSISSVTTLDTKSSGALENAGVVDVGSGAAFNAESQDYTQTAGSTTVDGTLSASNFNLNGGSLDGAGIIHANVINAATTVSGDQPGTLTVQGNYTQASAGALDIDIASATQFGQLAVTGPATLDGTLNVSLLEGFMPQSGDHYQIMDFASRSGDFANKNGFDLAYV